VLDVDEVGWSSDALLRLPSADARWATVSDFYGTEAELLDGMRVDDWIERCVDQGIRYYMPSRASRTPGSGSEFSGMPYFDEDIEALRTRARRLHSEFAWAEIPPSRTRRHITNVRVYVDPNGEANDGQLRARSYLFLVRSRSDRPTYDFLSCERFDTLIDTADGLRLRSRHIFVDQSCLGVINLAVFL
jgi:PAH dioxygenase small subunit